jgi:hypothetical protein
MVRKFIFFASHIPERLFVAHTSYCMSRLNKTACELMIRITESEPSLAKHFRLENEVTEIIIHNECPDRDDALSYAFSAVRGILDVFSFVTFNSPKLIHVVIVQEDGASHADVEMFDFETTGKAFIGDDAVNKINARSDFLLRELLLAFDVATNSIPHHSSDLCAKIKLAVRMFHHGRRSHDLQLQFLCKFTAAEAIVCGSTLFGRGRLLKDRIPQLVRQLITADKVNSLWELRCGASHEGSGEWVAFAHALPEIDFIAAACLLFAVAHAETAHTIDDLWQRVGAYQLPTEFTAHADFGTWPVSRVIRKLTVLNVVKMGWSTKIEPSVRETRKA